MYKVKRFSQCSISDVDVKWYSCNEYQKEFNIVGDLYHSGSKRTWKKYVGKARRSIGDRIKSSIDKDAEFEMDAVKRMTNNKDPRLSSKITEKLNKEAARLNTKPFDFQVGGSPNSTISSDVAKKPGGLIDKIKNGVSEKLGKVIEDAANNHDHLIFNSPSSGSASYAHELGHIQNSKTRNPIKRIVNKVANSDNTRNEVKSYKSHRGLGSAVKGYLRGTAVVIEESNASKNALKTLKKSGATEGEIKSSKKYLDAALDTYKVQKKRNYKYPLHNLIQIPSKVKME